MEQAIAGGTQGIVIPFGENCALRGVAPKDAGHLHRLIESNRSRLREWLPWLDGSQTVEQTREFVAQSARQNEDRTAFTAGIWIEGDLAGAIGLHPIDRRHRNTSIGYWLAEEFSGRGIMTAACKALVSEGFRRYGLHRIEIRCATENRKSAAIPVRLGFREEGILAEAEWLYDHWVDLRVFSMLEQHWRG